MSVTGKLNACNTKSDLALVLLRVAVINDILASCWVFIHLSSQGYLLPQLSHLDWPEFLDSQTIRDAQQPDAVAALKSQVVPT